MSAQAVRGTKTPGLDQLDFHERRQLIASSLSLSDILHVGAKEVAAVAGQYPAPRALLPTAFRHNSIAKLNAHDSVLIVVSKSLRTDTMIHRAQKISMPAFNNFSF